MEVAQDDAKERKGRGNFYLHLLGNMEQHPGASLVAQLIENLPVMLETYISSLGREDPLEKKMETHSSVRAWEIQWTQEPGRLESMGSGFVKDSGTV